jgi:hypothetical protein
MNGDVHLVGAGVRKGLGVLRRGPTCFGAGNIKRHDSGITLAHPNGQLGNL